MNRSLCLRFKVLHRFIILSVFLLVHSFIYGQNAKADSLFKVYAAYPLHNFSPAEPYYIISWKKAIPQNIKIIRQLDEKLAIVQLTSQSMFDLLKQNAIIAEARNEWKFSPFAEQLILHHKKEQSFIISALSVDSLLSLLQSWNNQLKVISINRPSHSIYIKATAAFVKSKLLPAKEVIFIDVRPTPHTEIGIIGYDRSFNGINTVDYSIPAANGKNIVAGVKEQNMDENDLDLYKLPVHSIIIADV